MSKKQTPKEKAEELVDKFMLTEPHIFVTAKQNALIAVDEILKEYSQRTKWNELINWKRYWQEVKNEIEKL